MENLQYIYFKDKKTCVTVTDIKKRNIKSINDTEGEFILTSHSPIYC